MMKSVVVVVALSLYLRSIFCCPVLEFGTVTKTVRGKVTFHTYTSTDIGVDTHIIELPTKLVIYDAQFILPNAKEVLLYAFNLKKPIERLIVSHSHPDHYFGIDVFDPFTKIYALPETIEEIKIKAPQSIKDNKARLPPGVEGVFPDQPTIPDFVAVPGEEFIDGVLFQFQKVVKSESSNALIVKMPFQKTILAGDFIFNRVHLFLAEKSMDNWIASLKALQTEATAFYDQILVGHSKPAPVTAIQENIDYLNGVKLVYSRSANYATFKSEMIRLFPLFQGADILDFAKKPFYPNEP